jgi:hypothetical protein
MMNAASPATVSAARPRICGEAQAYWVPPQLAISTSAVIQTVSRPVPSQSMRARPVPRGSRARVIQETTMATAPSGRLT